LKLAKVTQAYFEPSGWEYCVGLWNDWCEPVTRFLLRVSTQGEASSHTTFGPVGVDAWHERPRRLWLL